VRIHDGDIEQARAHVDEVCAEVEHYEAMAKEASSDVAGTDTERLRELRGRCEALESGLAGLEGDQTTESHARRGLQAALVRAKERLDLLLAAQGGEVPEPRFAGVAGVAKAARQDAVCTDERDDNEPPDPGELEGSLLGVGAAIAGLMPLESPGARSTTEKTDRPEGHGPDDSETCKRC